MENKPKKSKALIITIIAIVLILLIGYLLFKNNNVFGIKTGNNAKVFSSLLSSNNSKKLVVQAGEDINKGDSVSKVGTDANNNPVVMKSKNGDNVYGYANENINNGDLGEITLNNGNSNSFWNSFSNFLNNLFGGSNQSQPSGGWTFNNGTGQWEFDPNATGGWVFDPSTGGWVPPEGGWVFDPNTGSWTQTSPQCSDTKDNDTDTFIDEADPNCHVDGDLTKPYVPTHYSESSNPPGGTTGGFSPQCSDTKDNDTDTFIDEADPNCHVDGDLTKPYVPTHYSESSNPPGTGDYTDSDLVASAVTPTSAIINTPTLLSATVINNGEGSTGYNFSSFFTITNMAQGGNTINGNDGTASNSFKNIFTKIIKKISYVSRVFAANDNVELSVVTPLLPAKASSPISVTYTFTSAGTYYARACADKRSINDVGVITETNEDNNCGEWTTIIVTSSLPTGGKTECSDTIDNDTDGLIDALDPNCHNANNIYIPTYDDESGGEQSTTYQCSDTLDNDTDGKIDEADPNCHMDGDLAKEYLKEHDDESNSETSGDNNNDNKCQIMEGNPLVFTDAEKARLEVLLRKFYLISSTLRTVDDISTIYNEIDQQKNFMSQIDSLTKQCYLDTNDLSGFYTGSNSRDNSAGFCDRNKSLCDKDPAKEFNEKANKSYRSMQTAYGSSQVTKHGNPWFNKTTGGSFPYTNETNGYISNNWLPGNGNPWVRRSTDPTPEEIAKFASTHPGWLTGNSTGGFKDGFGLGCKVVSGYYYGGEVVDNGVNKDCDSFNYDGHNTQYGDCYHTNTKITGNGDGAPDEYILGLGCKWKDGVDLGKTERILNIW